jgi:CRP/FNR family transcriptional regulator, cyclic AMP receptor protein
MQPLSYELGKLRHQDRLALSAQARLVRMAKTRSKRSLPMLFSARAGRSALVSVPMFEGFSKREIAMLGRTAEPFNVPAGTVLARESHPVPQFVVLSRGVAKAESDGVETKLLSTGDHFGELTLLEGAPHVATVTALTDVSGYAFGRRAFWDAMHSVPALAVRLAMSLGEQLGASRRATSNIENGTLRDVLVPDAQQTVAVAAR